MGVGETRPLRECGAADLRLLLAEESAHWATETWQTWPLPADRRLATSTATGRPAASTRAEASGSKGPQPARSTSESRKPRQLAGEE